jgi:hypothetical protein
VEELRPEVPGRHHRDIGRPHKLVIFLVSYE